MAPSEMAMTRAIERRARRSYEMGRAGRGLALAWPAAPVAGASFALCSDLALCLTVGPILVTLCAALWWRGGVAARSVRPGLAAGLLPLALPTLASGGGLVCGGGVCLPACLLGCAAGGLLAAVTLSTIAIRRGTAPASFLFYSGLTAALTGSLGCLAAGSAGLAVMAAGLALGCAPGLALSRRAM